MKKDSGYYLAMLDCCQGVSSKREDIGSTTRWNIARQLNYIICTWTLDRARTRSLHQSTKFVGKAITYGLAIIRFGCRPSNFGLHWFMVVQQCQLLSFILAVLEPQGKYFGIIGFQFAFFMKKKIFNTFFRDQKWLPLIHNLDRTWFRKPSCNFGVHYCQSVHVVHWIHVA